MRKTLSLNDLQQATQGLHESLNAMLAQFTSNLAQDLGKWRSFTQAAMKKRHCLS
jgi:hypothetical protein